MTLNSLIPAPVSCSRLPGEFVFDEHTAVHAVPGAEPAADLLRDLFASSRYRLPPAPEGAADITIRLHIDPGANPESYSLHVTPERVRIVAVTVRGAMHAVQTLRQLLPDAAFRPDPPDDLRWQAPCVLINDAPRSSWRGAMLDVARHFMPAGFLLRFVDLLASHKFSTLHLHLTDDQGWRLEIAKYPLLTETGAWRAGTMIGHKDDQRVGHGRHDEVPHGGYYTAAQIREIVTHAATRGITVVPEIDMPGHMQAAIAAYPWLGNTERRLSVATGWGPSEHVLNVTDRTLAFCRDVLEEVVTLFPSRCVHIGGDECSTAEWRSSAPAQARISELGLSDENALRGWFISRVAEFVVAQGRRPVVWDEMVDVGLPDEAMVMSWRGERGGVTAARLGHDVIMAPSTHTYFDQYQSSDPSTEPLAAGGLLDLAAVYGYEPIPIELEPRYHHRLLGSQFQIWTEYIRTPSQVEYMSFPRACAVADVLWNPRHDLGDFKRRLAGHLGRLRGLGINYRSDDDPA